MNYEITSYIKQQNFDRKNSQIILSDLHKLLTLTCKLNHVVYEKISPSHIDLEQIFSSTYSYESVKQRFFNTFSEVVAYFNGIQDIASSHYIKQAISIIQSRFYQDLSLESISDEIGISSSYLSTLFKKVTGMTPTLYVQNTLDSNNCSPL